MITQAADPDAEPAVVEFRAPPNATFKITDTKLYVAVVTLLTQDHYKLLEQLNQDLTRAYYMCSVIVC